MNIKSGYSFVGSSVCHGEDLRHVRQMVGLNQPTGDLLADELSDIALAAIVRFSILKTFLYSHDAALSCLAAGIIGAARSLADRYFHTDNGWRTDGDFESWPSAVVKYAGAHLKALTQRPGIEPVGWGDAIRDIYICNNNCVPRSLASTVSDDAGLDRKDLLRLYEEGVLIKPTPKAWKDFCTVADLFSGNQFDLRNGGDLDCRLSFKFANQNHGVKPWAPARTMALMGYAASIAPRAAKMSLSGSNSLREMVRLQYQRFSRERLRFSMWVCGNSAEPGAQLKCFDLLVAGLFDRTPFVKKEYSPEDSMLRYYRRATLYSPIDASRENVRVRLPADSGTVEMRIPPWAEEQGHELFCPNIVPSSIGVFEAF